MNLKILIIVLALIALPALGGSKDSLIVPYNADLSYEKLSENDNFLVIVGKDGLLPKKRNSQSPMMLQQVWKIQNFNKTTHDLYKKIKLNLNENNYKIIFDCNFRSCGGFEFRFDSNILNEPEMHVNLGDYRFITAENINNNSLSFITYIISKGEKTGYVQINKFGSNLKQKANIIRPPSFTKNWATAFNDKKGSIILEGLKFKTGSAEIIKSNLQNLSNLANFLILHKNKKIILVGHTDAIGPIKGNIKLSKERAKSVQSLFVTKFGVNPNQISTNGVGFLSPIASNNTEFGRGKNRRVEVVMVPKFN